MMKLIVAFRKFAIAPKSQHSVTSEKNVVFERTVTQTRASRSRNTAERITLSHSTNCITKKNNIFPHTEYFCVRYRAHNKQRLVP